MMRCSKIGRPLHKCSQQFLDEMVVKIYTIHVMPGDHIVHRDEIPRELFFVSSGAVQVVDEHDQVVSMIRSDVPDTAPIVGEVPFFLGINYLNAIKASLDGDVELQRVEREPERQREAEARATRAEAAVCKLQSRCLRLQEIAKPHWQSATRAALIGGTNGKA